MSSNKRETRLRFSELGKTLEDAKRMYVAIELADGQRDRRAERMRKEPYHSLGRWAYYENLVKKPRYCGYNAS